MKTAAEATIEATAAYYTQSAGIALAMNAAKLLLVCCSKSILSTRLSPKQST